MSYTSSMRDEVERRVQTVTARDFSSNPSDGQLTVTKETQPNIVAGKGLSSPMAIVFLFLIFFFVTRFIIESSTGEKETPFRDIHISLWNVFAVTAFAIPGLVITKALAVRFLNPKNPLAAVILAS